MINSETNLIDTAAPREDFTVERAEGGYRIISHIEGAHRLFWSAYPRGFCDDYDLGEFTDGITVADPLGGRRCYFHIMTGSRYSVAATRAIELEGLHNFRELGGYNTADGRAFVKHGLLLRSDRLCSAGDEGAEKLRRMGVKTVIDFRVGVEAEKRADPEIKGASFYNLSPIDPDDYLFKYSLAEAALEGPERLISLSKRLIEQYRALPYCADAYGRMFELLLESGEPLLFHCTAGKDRTGVAALLILLALGVPRETAIYDYLLTQTVRAAEIARMSAEYEQLIDGDEQARFALQTFFSVHRESIEGTLEAIDERYPNDLDGFFEKELKLDAKKRGRLREMYLTKHIEKDGTTL